MSKGSIDLLRSAVRTELGTARTHRGGAARRAGGRLAAVSLVAALALGGAGVARGELPKYEMAVLPGLAGLDVGLLSKPTLVDLDGDGDQDLVVGGDSLTHYFRNTGSSTAPAWVSVSGTESPLAAIGPVLGAAPRLSDLDGDGDLDAVLGGQNGVLRYWDNTGSSATPAYVEATGTANPFAAVDVGDNAVPELADLDGDGDLDAVVGEDTGLLFYLRNTGSFAVPAFVEMTGSGNPFSGVDVGNNAAPDLVDLDADGDLDAVVGEFGPTKHYFRNTGSSSAPAFVEILEANNPFSGINTGTLSVPTLADVDGDADLDAVVGKYFGNLRYLQNTGSSTAPAFALITGTNDPVSGADVGFDSTPTLADVDGDGDLDAASGEEDPLQALTYYRNTGSATDPRYVEVTDASHPLAGLNTNGNDHVVLADLDADDDLDAVLARSSGTAKYYRNTGSSTAPSYLEIEGFDNPFSGISGSLLAPALADLDADGDLDAVVGQVDGTLHYHRNVGSATFPSFAAAATGSANPFAAVDVGTRSAPALADFDLDGDLDAVVGSSSANLHYFQNTGSATAPAYLELSGTASPFPQTDVSLHLAPAVADVDGDGDVDVVVGEEGGWFHFLRSRLAVFADGFESGDTSAWSQTVP